MTDAGKQVARDYVRAFRDRDEARRDRFIAPGFLRHDLDLDFEVRGPTGVRRIGVVVGAR